MIPDTNLQLDLEIDSLEWMNLSLDIRRQASVETIEAKLSEIASSLSAALQPTGSVGG